MWCYLLNCGEIFLFFSACTKHWCTYHDKNSYKNYQVVNNNKQPQAKTCLNCVNGGSSHNEKYKKHKMETICTSNVYFFMGLCPPFFCTPCMWKRKGDKYIKIIRIKKSVEYRDTRRQDRDELYSKCGAVVQLMMVTWYLMIACSCKISSTPALYCRHFYFFSKVRGQWWRDSADQEHRIVKLVTWASGSLRLHTMQS